MDPAAGRAPQVKPDVRDAADSLPTELRRLYARLDDYRREPTISPRRERQREHDLAEYDTVLLRACSVYGIPAGLRAGQSLSIERRRALTQALARAGLDVRFQPSMQQTQG